jgi:hypothetical protein
VKKTTAAAAAFLVTAAFCQAIPLVDGTVGKGEYARSISLVYGDATVSYQSDSSGGLYVAVSASTTGWVGIGLGSVVMDGAHIFMGYVSGGKPVFSEQVGEGHSHHPTPISWADQGAVAAGDGVTTLEIHIPAARLLDAPKKMGFIVAFSGSADLTTYHDDNHDGGFMELPAAR